MVKKNKITDHLFSIAGFIMLLFVFLIDLQTEIGIADGLLYTGTLFLFIGVSDTKLIAVAGILAIILDIGSFFLSPHEMSPKMEDISITNHLFSIAVLVVTNILIIRYRTSVNVLRLKMQELKDFKHALDEAAMVAIADKEGNLLKVNEKFSEISKYSREELIGKNHTVINSGEHAAKFTRALSNAVANKQPLKGEFINKAKDGSFYWVDTTIVPFVNEEGEIYQYVAIGTDVTVRKKIEEQVIRQKEELEKFLYISSHDLQEPLRKIQSYADLILEKEQALLSDAGKEYLKKLEDGAKRIREQIRDLVTYADFNKSVYEFEPTDLAEITEKVKTALNDIITEKQATVEYIGDCRPAVIKFQFYQLIHNLVSNAIKFSHPRIPPQIVIKCRLEKAEFLHVDEIPSDTYYCHITVQDNGIGFSTKDNQRIFEIFKTLHGKGKYEGTGIGLAIVKRIVDNHNGIIMATGDVTKGATFDIYIPASESSCALQIADKSDGVDKITA